MIFSFDILSNSCSGLVIIASVIHSFIKLARHNWEQRQKVGICDGSDQQLEQQSDNKKKLQNFLSVAGLQENLQNGEH
jgi:hypothetical protein